MISTRSTLSSTYAEGRSSAIARASAKAGQSAVAGHEQDADRPDALLLLQDRQAGDVLGGLRGARGHPPDGVRVRPQVLDPLLRAAQARGGDHLHRTRDLPDVLDRPDAAADVLQGGHLGGSRLLLLLRLGGLVAGVARIAARPRLLRAGLL